MDREVVELYLDDIIPNRFQPREIFNEQALRELADSIKAHGVIQPIIVRKIGDKYEIIAGERRYKASAMAGLTKIPAIIRNLDDKEASKVALLENLQRKDLTPIEEARTYQKILDLDSSVTQEELGRTMGKSQGSIANKMRLLSLPDEVQEALLKNEISERHARSLLNLEKREDQVSMLQKIVNNRMTVRELDKEINRLKGDVVSIMPEVSKEVVIIDEPKNPSTIEFNQPVEQTIEPSIIDFGQTPSKDTSRPIIDFGQTPSKDTSRPIIDFGQTTLPNNSQQIIDFNKTQEPEKEEIIFDIKADNTKDTTNEVNSTRPQTLPDELNNILLSPRTLEYPENKVEEIKSEKTEFTIEELLDDEELYSLKDAINQIKECVKKVQSKGFMTKIDEMDFESTYQIIIQIDKNN